VLFVLDLDEVHAGVAEEFQVLVDRRLALVVGGVEVQEEGRRDVVLRGLTGYKAKKGFSFVH